MDIVGERLKKQGLWVLGIVIAFTIIGTVSENNRISEEDARAKATALKSEIRDSCFNITDEDFAMKAGPVGSTARQSAVDNFYEEVLTHACVVWKNDQITTNPFYKVQQSDFNSTTLKLAYYETLRGWNGEESLGGLTCADGWNSPSIGKSGACSHHGGVVSKFDSNPSHNLASGLSRAGMRTIYQPGSSIQEFDFVPESCSLDLTESIATYCGTSFFN
jgi:hypothetical protein